MLVKNNGNELEFSLPPGITIIEFIETTKPNEISGFLALIPILDNKISWLYWLKKEIRNLPFYSYPIHLIRIYREASSVIGEGLIKSFNNKEKALLESINSEIAALAELSKDGTLPPAGILKEPLEIVYDLFKAYLYRTVTEEMQLADFAKLFSDGGNLYFNGNADELATFLDALKEKGFAAVPELKRLKLHYWKTGIFKATTYENSRAKIDDKRKRALVKSNFPFKEKIEKIPSLITG